MILTISPLNKSKTCPEMEEPMTTTMETGLKKHLYHPRLSVRASVASCSGSFCRISSIRIREYCMGACMYSCVVVFDA